jgi:hypothetical protein
VAVTNGPQELPHSPLTVQHREELNLTQESPVPKVLNLVLVARFRRYVFIMLSVGQRLLLPLQLIPLVSDYHPSAEHADGRLNE